MRYFIAVLALGISSLTHAAEGDKKPAPEAISARVKEIFVKFQTALAQWILAGAPAFPADVKTPSEEQRAGMAVRGVSRNNRAVERHQGPQSMYWKNIEYATSRENIFTDPIHLNGTGREFIFPFPNVLHGSPRTLLDAEPIEIISDKCANENVVNGLEGIAAGAGLNRRSRLPQKGLD